MSRKKFRVRYIKNWRNRPHPIWFFRNYDTIILIDFMPIEITIRKKR